MLALLAAAQGIIALDATIVFVAIPSIASELEYSRQTVQWVVSAYTITFGGFLLLGGRLADVLGNRRMFIAGQALFSVASLAAGLANGGALLIGARAVQGVGAAILFPATLATLNAWFEEGPARLRALAVWSTASVAGLALGALLGGLLTQWFSWRAIFLVNVPIASGCALMAIRWLPRDGRSVSVTDIDFGGGIVATCAGTLLVLSIVEAPDLGWLSLPVVATLCVAAALLVTLWQIEKRVKIPLIPWNIISNQGLQLVMLLTVIFMGSFGAQYYFLSLYYQEVYAYTTLQAGLAFLVPTAVCAAGIRLSERVVSRTGVGSALRYGFVAGACGIVLIRFALPTGYLSLLPGLCLSSVSQGLVWTAMWALAARGVPDEEQGITSGIASTAQQIGGALVLAAQVAASNVGLNGLTGDALRRGLAEGIERVITGMAILALVGAVASLAADHVGRKSRSAASRAGDSTLG
ncbi:MFS transporter [Trinickia fusca]|uniref:MFS transporter n=1 Tax=Trinickia fusca TaxID=2419777 RepID=A0A494XEY8_9BURK|nr:MFS transporter [Trinickia fusca]RKP48241.1 MFS transporter [Trinickia fusca]